jgi:hypothetical protein
VFVSVVLGVNVPTASATVTPIPEPACGNGGCFDLTNAMAVDRHLSVDIGPRRVGTTGAVTARNYLTETMSTFGLVASQQQFPLPAGGNFWNVVGKPADNTMDVGPYLVVGGHYDTVSGAPGANDNGTGTAAIVDIARAIAAQPATLPVVFVAFGAEEVQPNAASGRVGSNYFVNHLTATQKSNLVAFINLDYIGHGTGALVRLRHIANTPNQATQRLQGLASSMGIPIEVLNLNSSDDAPFSFAGLNAGSLRGMDDPNYHTPSDTYSRVQTAEYAAAGRLAVAAIRSYAVPPPPVPAWSRVEQNVSGIGYAGYWVGITDSQASGGSFRRSSATSASSTFVFNGTGVRWIGITSPNGGIANVTLDEVPAGTVDQYASVVGYRRVQFERTGLGAGQHTLVVSVSGQRNARAADQRTYVDAFEFFP